MFTTPFIDLHSRQGSMCNTVIREKNDARQDKFIKKKMKRKIKRINAALGPGVGA